MSTVEAQASLPVPLVKITAHPLVWVKQKIIITPLTLVVSALGMLAAVAIYYLLLEVNPTMTALWHHFVPDDTLRHSIRNIGEGLVGGLFGQFVGWNHYKKRSTKLSWLDRVEIKLRIANIKDDRPFSVGQLVVSPLMVLLYAVPGFLIAYYAVLPALHAVLHVASLFQPALTAAASPKASSMIDRFSSLLTQDLDKKVLGFGTSLFWGRRVARANFDDMQLYIVEKRVRSGKPVPRWYPPAFQARYNQVRSSVDLLGLGAIEHNHTTLMRWARTGAAIVAVGLVGFGAYVLAVIAR